MRILCLQPVDMGDFGRFRCTKPLGHEGIHVAELRVNSDSGEMAQPQLPADQEPPAEQQKLF